MFSPGLPRIPAPRSVSVGFGLPAASTYAASMSILAVFNKLGSITLPAGPAASTVYIIPVTSGLVIPVIDAPVIGVVPMFPVIWDRDPTTFVIPASERITKFPADLRLTVGGLAALAAGTGAKTPVHRDRTRHIAMKTGRAFLISYSSPFG